MLRVNPVAQQMAGVAFPISGDYDVSAAPLQFSDVGGYTTIPPVNQLVAWKFMHPGLAAGNWTITLIYPNTSLSASVSVVVVAVGGVVFSAGTAAASSSATGAALAVIPPQPSTSVFAAEFLHPPFV